MVTSVDATHLALSMICPNRPIHTQYPTMFDAASVEPDVFSDSLTDAFALEGLTSEFSHVVAEPFVDTLASTASDVLVLETSGHTSSSQLEIVNLNEANQTEDCTVAKRLAAIVNRRYCRTRQLKRKVTSQETMIKKLKDQLCTLQSNPGAAIVGGLAFGKHIPVATHMLVALRRNYGNASLRSTSVLAGICAGHNTIRRWEIKAALCVQAEARSWHAEHQSMYLHEDYDYAVSAHRFSAHGTNSQVCNGKSLQTCQVVSHYNLNGATADLEVWPDPLTIEGKSGADCFDLTKKQCESVLCPLFDMTEPTADGGGRRWTWKMATTDGGPDQKGCRQRLEFVVRKSATTAMVGQWCFQHEVSNGNKALVGM